MPPTHTQKPPTPTRKRVWFVVLLGAAGALTKTCTYFWNEGRLVTQRVLLPSGFYEDDWYFYDESGSPYGFNFTNSNNESGIRYFVRNLQGDIIESGSSTSFGASHKYDAWGTVTETVLGSSTNAANFQYGYIFGYRGYQYDKETGLYYCQSRYYNPRTARWLNADDSRMLVVAVSNGDFFTTNLYQYARNNPVMNIDPFGEESFFYSLSIACFNLVANDKLSFPKKYIYNQAKGNAAKVRMGIATGSFNGCGWVAIYNALHYLKMWTHPSKIVFDIEMSNGMYGYGTLGISPAFALVYFRKKNKNTKLKLKPKNIDKEIKNAKCAILTYTHSQGAHYIFVRWVKKEKKYYAYNVWSVDTDVRKFDSIEAFLKKGSNNKKYTPIALVTIN